VARSLVPRAKFLLISQRARLVMLVTAPNQSILRANSSFPSRGPADGIGQEAFWKQ
jgi:hypothetical protein